jgi:hypothetical protein
VRSSKTSYNGMFKGNELFKGAIDWRQRVAVDVFHS